MRTRRQLAQEQLLIVSSPSKYQITLSCLVLFKLDYTCIACSRREKDLTNSIRITVDFLSPKLVHKMIGTLKKNLILFDPLFFLLLTLHEILDIDLEHACRVANVELFQHFGVDDSEGPDLFELSAVPFH